MTATHQHAHPRSLRHPVRRRPVRAGVAGAGALAVLLAGVLSGCTSTAQSKEGDTRRPDTQQLPVLQTVLPSAAPNGAPITVSPYPSSTASPERGDNVGTG